MRESQASGVRAGSREQRARCREQWQPRAGQGSQQQTSQPSGVASPGTCEFDWRAAWIFPDRCGALPLALPCQLEGGLKKASSFKSGGGRRLEGQIHTKRPTCETSTCTAGVKFARAPACRRASSRRVRAWELRIQLGHNPGSTRRASTYLTFREKGHPAHVAARTPM